MSRTNKNRRCVACTVFFLPLMVLALLSGRTAATQQNVPQGQQAMQAAMMAMMIASMFASSKRLKKDIEPLDTDEYAVALTKLRDTPIVRYNYKWEPTGHRKHTGPILEMSPPDIREDAWRINILDYNGLLHAGVKSLDRRVEALEGVLAHA